LSPPSKRLMTRPVTPTRNRQENRAISSPGTPDMEERPKTFLSQKTVSYIGVPFCEGQNLEGADLAPVAIREAGLQTALARIGWGWDDVSPVP
jgi:arginase family enzyme